MTSQLYDLFSQFPDIAPELRSQVPIPRDEKTVPLIHCGPHIIYFNEKFGLGIRYEVTHRDTCVAKLEAWDQFPAPIYQLPPCVAAAVHNMLVAIVPAGYFPRERRALLELASSAA